MDRPGTPPIEKYPIINAISCFITYQLMQNIPLSNILNHKFVYE